MSDSLRIRDRASAALSLAPLIVFFALVARLWAFTLDDAFISARYAANWASGAGLVFNPGERVEGFSNFFFIVLLSIASGFGVSPVLAAKSLGVVAGAVSIVTIARASTPSGLSPAQRALQGALVGGVLAASGGLVYHAIAGLETMVYGALVLIAALGWRRDASPLRVLTTTLVTLFAALTRPEGALLLVLAVGSVALGPRDWRRWLAAAPAVGVGALLLLARKAYFGAWLPNTYLAKPAIADAGDLFAGLEYLGRALLSDGRFLLVPAALVVLFEPRARRWAAAPLVALTCGACFCVWSGGDWVVRARFFAPYEPLLIVLAGAGAGALVMDSRRRQIVLAVVATILIGLRVGSAVNLAGELAGGAHDPAHVSTAHVAVGRWLAANTPACASIVADEIGAIGYHSDRRIVDLHGLVDREIAELFHEAKFNPYAGDRGPAEKLKMWRRVVPLLMARGPDLVLADYRGPADAPVDPALINPTPLRRALDAGGYVRVKRFAVDDRRPKAFLLYQSPKSCQ